MVIYFDNAATTYPKPEEVYRAQDAYLRRAANPGRGVHTLAVESARAIFETRVALASFLGVKSAERLVFTGGCTQALNMALKGFGLASGDLVITSPLEHNSVMRPLHQLERAQGIKVQPLSYKGSGTGVVDLDELTSVLANEHPRLCVMAEASNVTGELLDIAEIAGACRKHGVPLLVDAAQSAGFTDARLDDLGISIWCASGHKGLLGPPGVGILYVSPEVELEPLIAGGTGSRSEELEMPGQYPDRLEPGTLSGPAIAGLGAGVAWLQATGIDRLRRHELFLAERFLSWAQARKDVEIYGPEPGGLRTAIVAFQVTGISADRVADILDRHWGIAVRAGLHCAAQAHRALGTAGTGLVRASFGYFNTADEVDELCRALSRIAASGG
ncbi:MAG TPA: aminotransferase class V-fold PLP-dependent enzyme [Candidatus Obscuribacterales bacterium]